jgi:Holliday junction resolvasome RuvABC ATP-dependent DNA helicase subunit
VNRCEELIFTDYDDIELLIIARESSSFYASDEAFMAVIEAGNRNPRVIKHLVDKLGMYFHRNQIDSRTADFGQILEEVFKIKDGLDTLCRRYIEVLSDVGGNASIILLKNLLHVGEDTLKNRVEPVLLRKGIIKITQKGRTLV